MLANNTVSANFSTAKELAFAFHNLTVTNQGKTLLKNISGYVREHSITAVVGPSAGGKSLLLKALAGHCQSMNITGNVYMSGRPVDPKLRTNPIAYVPQEDYLIGELTPREMTRDTAYLRRNESSKSIDRDIWMLLMRLGLDSVADSPIGNHLFRGLSGGQKKRTQVASALIASPSILLLDEPTSGLDSFAAFETLNCIRDILNRAHGMKLSVMLTIHQPNSKLLSLFDDIMILDRGEMNYFGTVPDSLVYFESIGFKCPSTVTPTDYYLQVTDVRFANAQLQLSQQNTSVSGRIFAREQPKVPNNGSVAPPTGATGAGDDDSGGAVVLQAPLAAVSPVFPWGSGAGFGGGENSNEFPPAFEASVHGRRLQDVLEKHKAYCATFVKKAGVHMKRETVHVPLWKQTYMLTQREYTIAYRDPTLYYFQFVLLMCFAVMTGAVFWDLHAEVNGNFNIFPSALLWLVLMNCWVNAFKVHYLCNANERNAIEIANGKYKPLAIYLAELISTATLTLIYIPVGMVTYFMMDFPPYDFPFVMFALWLTSLTAEAMVAVLVKLTENPTTAMVFTTIALVTLQVFGGGLFTSWQDCPDYWLWLQESTVFTQATRAINMMVFKYVMLHCHNPVNGICTDPGTGDMFKCTDNTANGSMCHVNAREILYATQGIAVDDSPWNYIGYLVAILVFLKLVVLFFTFMPINELLFRLRRSERLLKRCVKRFRRTGTIRPMYRGYESDFESKPDSCQSDNEGQHSRSSSLKIKGFYGGIKGTYLTWSNFTVTVPKTGEKLIDNVSGYVQSGSVLALMGPSGAGKTTLLNGLADRIKYADVTGCVKFAGRVMTSQDLNYVPQYNELNETLTVEEHINLVGKLTCLDEFSMLERLEEILSVLGLKAKRAVAVRRLSGGEKKRLSIAVGLISKPRVLFLDEPTTGLDSTAAYSVASFLSKLAQRTNVAIIMTLHQPSALVYNLLDDLLLLERGNLVYSGSCMSAGNYFASIGYENPFSINPADYFLDICKTDAILLEDTVLVRKSWTDLFNSSVFGIAYLGTLKEICAAADLLAASALLTNDVETYSGPNILTRYVVMTQHFFSAYWEECFLHRLGALLIIAVVLGSLFFNLHPDTIRINSYLGAMFSIAIAVMLSAVASTALFARGRAEAEDRILNGFYQPGVFVAAQFTVSLVYNLIVVVVFGMVFHFFGDIEVNVESCVYNIVLSWGHVLVMESFLMIMIEILKIPFLSTSAGMIFLGSNMLFAGFFRQQREMPDSISWLCYVFPLHWSYGGVIWKIIGPIKFMVANSIPKEKVTGAWFLDNVLHVTYVDPWLMLGVLMAYVVLFRLIQYSLLAYQTGTLPFTALYLCGTTQSKRHLRCAAIATDQPSADALQAATLTLELAMSKQLEVSKDIPPNDGGTLDFDISVQNVGAANESSSNDKAARPYRSLRDKPLSGHAHGFGSAEPESESVPDGYPPSKSEKLSAVEVSAHVSWKD